MNIKDYLTDLIENGIDFYDLPYELEIDSWPDVVDEDGNEEPLDCENFEWLSIEDDEMVVSCGGDWQEPMTLTIKMVDEGLAVVSSEEGYSEGMSEDEFYEALDIEKEDDDYDDYDDEDEDF